MQRPVIGITVDYVTGKPHYMLPWTYAEAVEKAGGLPMMLPYKADLSLVSQYLDQLDGVVLAGGDDLNPASYGETYHPQAQRIDPDRERFDHAVLDEIERRTMPVLGICLGSQLMNVHRGGSLHQFLPDIPRDSPLEHRRLDDWTRRHEVFLEPDSLIAQALGKTQVISNTSHKQSVKTLGRGLRITARAPDGVIEGTEDPTKPFYVGVQWHPERQNDEADHLKLFELLVEHAGRRRV
jgi:putative glutamine amidotransferase